MGNQTKVIQLLTDVEKIDAKLFAIALAQAAITIELADRIGFDLDGVEFTVQTASGQVLRFKLADPPVLLNPGGAA